MGTPSTNCEHSTWLEHSSGMTWGTRTCTASRDSCHKHRVQAELEVSVPH